MYRAHQERRLLLGRLGLVLGLALAVAGSGRGVSAQACGPAQPLGPWPPQGAADGSVTIKACDSWVHADLWIPGGTIKAGYDEVSVLFAPGTSVRVKGVAGQGWRYDEACGEEYVRSRIAVHQERRRREENKRITTVPPSAVPLIREGVAQDLVWDPSSDTAQLIDMIDLLPIDHVRMDLRWCVAEPVPGTYRTGRHDEIIGALVARGVEVIAILDDPPKWATGDRRPGDSPCATTTLPPDADHLDEWRDFVARTVERYDGDQVDSAPGSPRVAMWEVWNEPNARSFWDTPEGPNAVEYARLLRIAHDAAKSADSSATVVMGGLSGNGVDVCWPPESQCQFVAQLYREVGRQYSEAVNIHPYVAASKRVGGPGGVQEVVDETVALMRSMGDTRPLWATEIGWRTRGPGASQAGQAERLAEVFCQLEGVQLATWFNLRDSPSAGPDPVGAYSYGVLASDLTPKLALSSWRSLPCKCPPGSEQTSTPIASPTASPIATREPTHAATATVKPSCTLAPPPEPTHEATATRPVSTNLYLPYLRHEQ